MKYSIVDFTTIINNCNSVDDLSQVGQLFTESIKDYNSVEQKVINSRLTNRSNVLKL